MSPSKIILTALCAAAIGFAFTQSGRSQGMSGQGGMMGQGMMGQGTGCQGAGCQGMGGQGMMAMKMGKYIAIAGVSAAVGASVAVSGGIGFIGIVVPHVLRLSIGPDNRYLLPASALLGATLLLLADALARTIVAPAELPIGIITAAVGGPFFLWILLRKRGVLDL